jgi:CheY-like chemotaxis protein
LRRGAEREDDQLMAERILIVEDEPAIAEAVEYALKAEGFEVEAVDDGNDALEQARTQPSREGKRRRSSARSPFPPASRPRRRA